MGIPCLTGPRFSPKLILDFLDEMSYPTMLSGTLEGLDNLVYFRRYGRTGWFGRSYYFYSKRSLPAIILHKKFVEGGAAVPHGLAVPQKTFRNTTKELQTGNLERVHFFGINIKKIKTTTTKKRKTTKTKGRKTG
jgi:hypothetical protein